MSKTIFLHVGMQKTGTTYLQSCLTSLQPELLSKRVCYPSSGRVNGIHRQLTLALAAGHHQEAELLVNSMLIEAAEADSVLISDENLSLLQIEKLRPLADILKRFNVIVIVYLRKWSDFFYSIWQEKVKYNLTCSLNDYLLSLYSTPLMRYEINFKAVLDLFAKLFGADSLIIIPYNNIPRPEFLAFFVNKVLNIDGDFTCNIKSQNVKGKPHLIELIRAVKIYETTLTNKLPDYSISGAVLSRKPYLLKYVDNFSNNFFKKYHQSLAVNNSSLVLAVIRDTILKKYGNRIVNGNPTSIFNDLSHTRYNYLNFSGFLPAQLDYIPELYEAIAARTAGAHKSDCALGRK